MLAKILVVDDEQDLEILIRQKFRKKIRQNQLQFVFAPNGIKALETLDKQSDIDIILTDINMPEMDGLTLLTKIKELYPVIKAVIISAYGDMSNIRAAMNRGAFDFLTKPIDFRDLEITTNKTLQHVQQMKASIAQERQAQEAMRESERKLGQFLEAVPVGIGVLDAEGKPLYVNQTAQKLLGKGVVPEATVEQLSEVYQLYHAGSETLYPSEQLSVVQALQGKAVTTNKIEIHRGNDIIPIETWGTPVFDSRGNIIYAIVAFQDITERKQAEAERVRFTQELEQKNQALQQAKDQLSLSNRTLEQKVTKRTQELSQTLEILKATQAELIIENSLLKDAEQQPIYQYQVGGSLPMDAPTYVVRQADRHLYQALKLSQFCYILNARQMGKSSLRVQIMKRLQVEGFACAAVDVSAIGNQHLTMEQWYAGFVYTLVSSFDLFAQVNIRLWWREHDFLSPVQRLGEFIDKVLLVHLDQKIIIFIDEIDSVVNLDFNLDDFFRLIRACFNKRADHREYRRLTFVLLGVATPSQLVQDKVRTPFNVGQAITLAGFQLHEAQPLLVGLTAKDSNPQALLKEVLAWTNGQPFLTQKLCKLIHACKIAVPMNGEAEWVENLVRTKIIDNWELNDEPEHLRTIRDRLCRRAQQENTQLEAQPVVNLKQEAIALLKLYQQVWQQGEVVAVDSPQQVELLLSGLVIKQQNRLKVHNRIYQLVFNDQWIKSTLDCLQT